MHQLIISLIIASICLFGEAAFSAELDLNEKEKAWLNSHSEIRLGAITGWPPYNFYDSNGVFSGISSDIIKRIESNTGLKFKYIKGDWDDLRLQIKERKIDILSAVYYTPERADYMLFSRPYSELRDYIFTRKDRNDIKDIKSIRRIAIVKGFSQGEIIKDKHPDIEITWYDSMLLALESVIAGHTDAYIGSIASVSYIISSKQLIDLKVAAPTGWLPVDVSMAVNTEHPELLGILNKAINTIDEKEINKINRQWFALEHEAFINYKILWVSIVIGLVLFAITSIWLFSLRREVKSRKKIEYELYASTQHLKLYRDQAPMATIEWNPDFQVVDWNKEAEKIFGYTVDEIRGRNFVDIMLPNTAVVDIKNLWENLMAQTGGEISVNENLTKDGQIILCEWHNTPLIDKSGNVIGAASIVQDITRRTELQEQLNHSQKMDALGKLTGGIAHDYNNMLSIILGYTELLEYKVGDDPELKDYIDTINHAADRGSKLTSKLLSFTRNKSINEESLIINTLLEYQKDMLEKTITPRIKLHYKLEDELWPVLLDSGELEDAIINLCINAMHAIDGNGDLTIKTNNITFKESEAQSLTLIAGDYIQISFTDTGSGIDAATKLKMFDPFYSTKGEMGTGLGLSQVYGFVQRSRGSISVTSELDKGTEIRLCFPRNNISASNVHSKNKEIIDDLNGTEVIMVVDDEEALLNLTSAILTKHGYNVICANGGKQALDLLEKESIDLLISDVIMPDMDGYELASIVQKEYPNIKIQMVSGFSTAEHITKGDNLLSQNLLQKPYNSQKLLEKIRSLLTS